MTIMMNMVMMARIASFDHEEFGLEVSTASVP
jgi:hypothetical protein